MKLIDTHCHVHESEFFDSQMSESVYQRAAASETAMICASTSVTASHEALSFTEYRDNTWALVGVHPHETSAGVTGIGELLELYMKPKPPNQKLVGIGEIGLDYFYMNSSRQTQITALEQQLQWALSYDLPVSFHIRDAASASEAGAVWRDFWPIFDNFRDIRGVMHSFTDVRKQLEQGFGRGLYVGVNGISTFTRDAAQQRLYSEIPLEKMLLETDAPFLTPVPFRGKVNEPSFVGRVAEHMATLRGVSPDLVSEITTANARRLFHI